MSNASQGFSKCVALAVSAAIATPVFAAEVDQLEEVVVTAQRRQENVQSVSVAVTAIRGEDLNDKAIARLDDLQYASPALTITDAALTRSINIRGIGLASGSPGVTPGVANYVDGVFQPPVSTSATFYDIGSIEVLRGPQGTFVGSSSTGGAIFINTRSPELGKFGGQAEAVVGNYNNHGLQAALNVPLGDTLAIRLAANYRQRDSYYDDLGPLHSKAGELDDLAGRVGLLWKPSDAFQLLAKVEGARHDTGGYTFRPIATTTYAPLRTSDELQIAYDDPTQNNERPHQSSLEMRYLFANGITLRSQSGYQNKRIYNLYDMDGTIQPTPGTGYPRWNQDQYVRERVWTQELNLISPTDGVIDWVGGLYFQRNKIDVVISQRSDGFPTNIDIHTAKTGKGAFAQVGFKLQPNLKLNVGGRYSSFDVTQVGSVVIGRGLPFPPFNSTGLTVANLVGGHDDGRATGKVALEWTPDENNLLYAFVARGYKPGGFNSVVSEFKPETVLDYEAGWKSTMLDGHLRTQIGGFYYDYKDFQLDLIDPSTGQTSTQNVANARLTGLEASMQAKVSHWGIDAGFAYVDSKLKHVVFVNQRALPAGTNLPQCATGVSPGTPPTCFNYTPYLTSATGRSMLYSPKVTFNAGVDYSIGIGESVLRPRVNYAYIGTQYTNLLYSPITDRIASRGILSAQLTWETGDNWRIEAFGTNLADKRYVSGQFVNNEIYGAPREYGLRVGKQF